MVLASFIAAYAVLVLVVPGFGPLFIGELRAVANWAVVARMSS